MYLSMEPKSETITRPPKTSCEMRTFHRINKGNNKKQNEFPTPERRMTPECLQKRNLDSQSTLLQLKAFDEQCLQSSNIAPSLITTQDYFPHSAFVKLLLQVDDLRATVLHVRIYPASHTGIKTIFSVHHFKFHNPRTIVTCGLSDNFECNGYTKINP
jgi:hypothetical protein